MAYGMPPKETDDQQLAECWRPKNFQRSLPVHRKFFLSFGGRMPLFLFIFIFYKIHTFIKSHSYNTFIRRHSPGPLSISSSLEAQWEKPPCGAQPRIELGPALRATN
jgi:hypothetical protein